MARAPSACHHSDVGTKGSIERIGTTDGRILVLLPGYADRPERFLRCVDEFDPDGTWTVVVLEPILSKDIGPYWYDVDDDGPIEHELDAAVGAVRDACAEIASIHGIPVSSLVLAGFSQGGALALALTLDPSVVDTPSAVAVLAGYLPARSDAAIDLTRAEGMPLLFVHGVDDEMVESLRGRSAAKALQRAGALVSWAQVDGGHRFADVLLEPLREWLDALARDERPVAPI